MKILVLGAGKVGYSIAKHLVSPDNYVTVVDKDEECLKEISNNLDVRPIYGLASYPDVLEKAGAANTDLIIATTKTDEINMIACEVANSIFEIELKIARIRQQSYLNQKYRTQMFQTQNLSIDFVVSPEVEVAKSISHSIKIGSASNVIDILDTTKMLSIRCSSSSPIINTPIRLLPNLFPTLDIAIVAIQRDKQTIIPGKDDIISFNDQIFFIVKSEQDKEAMAIFGYIEQVDRQITIVGCGNVGKTLAKEIESSAYDINLKVIEIDPHFCELGSRILKNAEILNGDALNVEILQEAGISECDTFISVTNDDNTNMISCLLAKNSGAKRAMALLSNTKNAQFAISLGVDSVINPNAITVSTILKAIRKHKIRSLYTIDGGIEVLEVDVGEVTNIVGVSVEDISTPGKVCVAALKRDNKVFLYPKKFTINMNDKLIIVVVKDNVYKIEKMLSGRASFR